MAPKPRRRAKETPGSVGVALLAFEGATLRRGILVLAAAPLSVAGISLAGSQAWAGVNHFRGAAPGSVTCDFILKVNYSPALKNGSGSASTEKISAQAESGSCTTSESANPRLTVGVKAARIPALRVPVNAGIVPQSAFDCGYAPSGGGTTSAGLTFKWLGSVVGPYAGKTYAGSANFAATPLTSASGSVSLLGELENGPSISLNGKSPTTGLDVGSFPGQVSGTLSLLNSSVSQVRTRCASHGGLTGVGFVGKITVGGGG